MSQNSCVPFYKMHGLGNDFIVIDGRGSAGFEDSIATKLPPARVRQLSDRRYGIGCDQFITVAAAKSNGAVGIRIFNGPDGAEVEACGNATRCVGAVIASEAITARGEPSEEQRKTSSTTLDILSGPAKRPYRTSVRHDSFEAVPLAQSGDDSTSHLIDRASWRASAVVDLGAARVDGPSIPLNLSHDTDKDPEGRLFAFSAFRSADDTDLVDVMMARGCRASFGAVNVGNPHVIFFFEKPTTLSPEDVSDWGKRVQKRTDLLPAGANISFLSPKPLTEDQIGGERLVSGWDLRVFERGSGLTEACGTGACAAGVAAVVGGFSPANVALDIVQFGGTLRITVSDELEVSMEGPATMVCRGEVAL